MTIPEQLAAIEKRLGEIRARERAAPKGPWFNADGPPSYDPAVVCGPSPFTDTKGLVASLAGANPNMDGSDRLALGVFVANARQDLPALLGFAEVLLDSWRQADHLELGSQDRVQIAALANALGIE